VMDARRGGCEHARTDTGLMQINDRNGSVEEQQRICTTMSTGEGTNATGDRGEDTNSVEFFEHSHSAVWCIHLG
jgi:hypothetical protein